MFADKLSARVIIFRHYLEVQKNDHESLKWTEDLFNQLVDRKSIFRYLEKISLSYNGKLVFDAKFIELISFFLNANRISLSYDRTGLNNINVLYNHMVHRFEQHFQEFIDKFRLVENSFLRLDYESFQLNLFENDKQLEILFQEKIEVTNCLLDTVVLLLIARYVLFQISPQTGVFETYQKINCPESEQMIKGDYQLAKYIELLDRLFYSFSSDLSEQFVNNKYPDLLAEILRTMRNTNGIFVTRKKYEQIMDQASKEVLHLELLLVAYHGYDFEISQKIVRQVFRNLIK